MRIVSVATIKFYYEGGIIYNNRQYLVTAEQRGVSSKVEVVVENLDDNRERYGKEFENIIEFTEWLKNK